MITNQVGQEDAAAGFSRPLWMGMSLVLILAFIVFIVIFFIDYITKAAGGV